MPCVLTGVDKIEDVVRVPNDDHEHAEKSQAVKKSVHVSIRSLVFDDIEENLNVFSHRERSQYLGGKTWTYSTTQALNECAQFSIENSNKAAVSLYIRYLTCQVKCNKYAAFITLMDLNKGESELPTFVCDYIRSKLSLSVAWND